MQKVETSGGGDSDFITEMTFDQSAESQAMLEFSKDFVQVDLKGNNQLQRREVLRVANKDFTSVILSQFSPEVVRVRLMLATPGTSNKFKGRVKVETVNDIVRVRVMSDGAPIAALDDEPTESVETTEASATVAPAIAATEQPAAQLLAGEMAATPVAAPVISEAPKAESEIPVLTKLAAPGAQGKSLWGRLVASLVVILLVAGGMVLFSKQWAKRRTGLSQHHQIKVLTQYGLGPKKSLAIVRVAGESILIGITDQNISMLKSLALLDEDLPMDIPKSFPEELQQSLPVADRVSLTGAVAKVDTKEAEDFSFGTVRDMVASRLREMRSL